jgi:hypothetical protein
MIGTRKGSASKYEAIAACPGHKEQEQGDEAVFSRSTPVQNAELAIIIVLPKYSCIRRMHHVVGICIEMQRTQLLRWLSARAILSAQSSTDFSWL